jgi:hypothetical protein
MIEVVLWTELFFLSIRKAKNKRNIDINNVNVTTKEEIDLTIIPTNYYEFTDLFSKRRADELFSHGLYDYKIPL